MPSSCLPYFFRVMKTLTTGSGRSTVFLPTFDGVSESLCVMAVPASPILHTDRGGSCSDVSSTNLQHFRIISPLVRGPNIRILHERCWGWCNGLLLRDHDRNLSIYFAYLPPFVQGAAQKGCVGCWAVTHCIFASFACTLNVPNGYSPQQATRRNRSSSVFAISCTFIVVFAQEKNFHCGFLRLPPTKRQFAAMENVNQINGLIPRPTQYRLSPEAARELCLLYAHIAEMAPWQYGVEYRLRARNRMRNIFLLSTLALVVSTHLYTDGLHFFAWAILCSFLTMATALAGWLASASLHRIARGAERLREKKETPSC